MTELDGDYVDYLWLAIEDADDYVRGYKAVYTNIFKWW